MKLWNHIAFTVLVSTAVAFAADPAVVAPDDAFQLRFVSNLDIGDSVVNLTNAGTQGGFEPTGAICANVYAFGPNQAMLACCSCYLSPNSLRSLSVTSDLMSNTLTAGAPNSIVIKLLATTVPTNGSCNGSLPNSGNVAPGMRAWGTTVHPITNGTAVVGTSVVETEFSKAVLSTSELLKLTSYCGFLQANGGGFGICRSCRTGGLGGTKME